MKLKVLSILSLFVIGSACATPPNPPEGMRWILQDEFSDEFNGDRLDTNKWNDYYPGWQGRPPAKFVRENVSVAGGDLILANTPLDKPDATFHVAGAAVTTKKEAFYGYYECRAKASRVNMSTTFWMSNGKVLLDETEDCLTDKFSQELDIQEAIGGSIQNPGFRKQMACNTHYRHIPCGETKEIFYSKGVKTPLESEVWEDYHTYAAWWIDAEQVKFYANDRFFSHVNISKQISKIPFTRPMHINMVTETYNWNPSPTVEELTNEDINKSYYDWMRAYRLVPVAEVVEGQKNEVELYFEQSMVTEAPKTIFESNTLEFKYEYRANKDQKMVFEIVENQDARKPKALNSVQTAEWTVLAGYGSASASVDLEFDANPEFNYKIRLTLVDENGDRLQWHTYDLSK